MKHLSRGMAEFGAQALVRDFTDQGSRVVLTERGGGNEPQYLKVSPTHRASLYPHLPV